MLRVAQNYAGSGTFGDTVVYKQSRQLKVQMAKELLMSLFGSKLFQALLCLLPSVCSLSKRRLCLLTCEVSAAALTGAAFCLDVDAFARPVCDRDNVPTVDLTVKEDAIATRFSESNTPPYSEKSRKERSERLNSVRPCSTVPLQSARLHEDLFHWFWFTVT